MFDLGIAWYQRYRWSDVLLQVGFRDGQSIEFLWDGTVLVFPDALAQPVEGRLTNIRP